MQHIWKDGGGSYQQFDIVILFVNQPLTVLNLPVLIVRLFIFIGAIVVMIVW
jgi:hypothetical protein